MTALLDGREYPRSGSTPAGFVMRARMLREPDEEGEFTERTQQAFRLARKPSVEPNVT